MRQKNIYFGTFSLPGGWGDEKGKEVAVGGNEGEGMGDMTPNAKSFKSDVFGFKNLRFEAFNILRT